MGNLLRETPPNIFWALDQGAGLFHKNMRFKITLIPKFSDAVIPINYQYPLSAAIYKVLRLADSQYAAFLHEKGYGVENSFKSFKLFTFSDLRMKFKGNNDRMHIRSNPQLTVSFHLPEAAQNFVKGLFINREIDIADKKSKATFLVEQVEALPLLKITEGTIISMDFDLLSMVVCGKKKENGEYDFLSPEDEDWKSMALYGWKEKCRAVGLGLSKTEWDIMGVHPIIGKEQLRSRLIAIKAGTKAQTQIKGYYGFGIKATGPAIAVQLLFNAGCGVYNSLGCGCLDIKT